MCKLTLRILIATVVVSMPHFAAVAEQRSVGAGDAQPATQPQSDSSQAENESEQVPWSGRQIDPERLFTGVTEQLGFENRPRLKTIPPERTKAFVRLDRNRSSELKSLVIEVHTCSVSESRNDAIEHAVIECFEAADPTVATDVLTGLSEVVASEEQYLREHGAPDGFRVDAIAHTEFKTLQGTLSRTTNTDLTTQRRVHCLRARTRCDDYVVQVSIQAEQRRTDQQIADVLHLLCQRLAGGDIYVQEATPDHLREALESVQEILRDGEWQIDSRKIRASDIDSMLGAGDESEIKFDEGLVDVKAIQFRNSGVPGRMRKFLVIVLLEYESQEAAHAQAEPFGKNLGRGHKRFGIVAESAEPVEHRILESGESLWTISGELKYMQNLAPFRVSSMQRGKRIACWIEMRNPIEQDQIPQLADFLFDE